MTDIVRRAVRGKRRGEVALADLMVYIIGMTRQFIAALLLVSTACSTQSQPAAAQAPGGKPFTATAIDRFSNPFAMALLPDGRLLVTEKGGALRLRARAGGVVTVTGVPRVATGGQGGLLDVAVSPDFAVGHGIYLTFSEARPGGSSLALARGTLTEVNGTARLDDVQVIWRAGSDGQGGQYGANIAFSPNGTLLYLASGERQRFTPAQDPNQALGKILRLTLDGRPAAGNPGAGKTGSATVPVFDPPADSRAALTAPSHQVAQPSPNQFPAETWSSGHRNPYGLAFDAGGRLWEVEMGPKGGDEVNLILPGGNYGWPNASNGDNYNGVPIPDHKAGDGFEAPKVWWNPSISPGGMMIYSGTMFPQWKGSMLIAALGAQALIRVTLNGDTAAKAEQWDMGARIRDIVQARDGAVLLLRDDGRLLRLTPAA